MYTSDDVVGFRDIAPQAPVHVLVVPREHIEHAGCLEEHHGVLLVAMFEAAREIAAAEGIEGPERGYRLVFNVGADAQNSVGHLHLHVLGGRPMTWPPG